MVYKDFDPNEEFGIKIEVKGDELYAERFLTEEGDEALFKRIHYNPLVLYEMFKMLVAYCINGMRVSKNNWERLTIVLEASRVFATITRGEMQFFEYALRINMNSRTKTDPVEIIKRMRREQD